MKEGLGNSLAKSRSSKPLEEVLLQPDWSSGVDGWIGGAATIVGGQTKDGVSACVEVTFTGPTAALQRANQLTRNGEPHRISGKVWVEAGAFTGTWASSAPVVQMFAGGPGWNATIYTNGVANAETWKTFTGIITPNAGQDDIAIMAMHFNGRSAVVGKKMWVADLVVTIADE